MTIPTVTGPCSRVVPLRSAIGFLALSVGSAIAEDRPGEPVGAGSALKTLVEVRLSDLHTEAGAIMPTGPTSFDLRHPGVRAVVPGAQGSSARISFVYRGPTREVLPLRSGELRRQIGLKLRARDTCNLIYVMWHLAPDEGIRVQVKSNPGARVHAECLDRGYRSLVADAARAAPVLRIGERHSLEARIEGKRLRVLADDQAVWQGTLPAEALAIDGPVGLRSDNGEFEVELWTARPGERVDAVPGFHR